MVSLLKNINSSEPLTVRLVTKYSFQLTGHIILPITMLISYYQQFIHNNNYYIYFFVQVHFILKWAKCELLMDQPNHSFINIKSLNLAGALCQWVGHDPPRSTHCPPLQSSD